MHTPTLPRTRLLSAGIAAVLGLALPLFTSVHVAQATDAAIVDTSGGQQDGRFLRLGVAKTAVVKLPVAAKDVIVGESEIVDVVIRNRNTAYLFARKAGQTNVFFFDANGQEILNLDLEVTLDSKGLKKLLDRSLPGNTIQVDSTGESVVLKGEVASAQQAKMVEDLARRFVAKPGANAEDAPVVNMLTIGQSQQVMLKVRVVELKRTILKQLGINLQNLELQSGSVSVALNNVFSRPLEEIANNNIFDPVLGLSQGGNKLQVKLSALEQQGLASTLAEPTLTAISGAPASFQAGGEFPFQVCTGPTNNQTCDVEFKPYGVALNFTPTVLDEGRIALNINTEVSEIADFYRGVPAFDTRKAQTSVEVPSGGSMVMAGLIKDVSRQEIEGAPGLKTLPVLGALFRSRDYQANQTELVVIVTPYIAAPVHESQLATPVDNYIPPTDLQQIFLGRLNRLYGTPGEHPEGVYHGRVGHIID